MRSRILFNASWIIASTAGPRNSVGSGVSDPVGPAVCYNANAPGDGFSEGVVSTRASAPAGRFCCCLDSRGRDSGQAVVPQGEMA